MTNENAAQPGDVQPEVPAPAAPAAPAYPAQTAPDTAPAAPAVAPTAPAAPAAPAYVAPQVPGSPTAQFAPPPAPGVPVAPAYGAPGAPGAPVYPGQPYGATPYPQSQAPMNVLAIISMIAGIVGLFTFGIVAVGAVVLGHIALSQIKKRHQRGRGMAIAGLITGYFSILVWGLLIVFGAFLGMGILAADAKGLSDYSVDDYLNDPGSNYGSTEEYGNSDDYLTGSLFGDAMVAEDTAIMETLTGADKVYWLDSDGSTVTVCPEALAEDQKIFGGTVVSGTALEGHVSNYQLGLTTFWQDDAVDYCGYTATEVAAAAEAGEKASDEVIAGHLG